MGTAHGTGWRTVAVLGAVSVLVGACGGGDSGDLGEDVFGGIGASNDDSAPANDPNSGDDQSSGDESSSDAGQGGSGEAVAGPLTQTADPGAGWVEVDGQRFDFTPFGSVHHSCEVLSDRITINFQQTTTGNDLTFQGALGDGGWIGSFTFSPTLSATPVAYGAGLDLGTLGIGDQALSYDGTLNRVEDYDLQNSQAVPAIIAINCAPPGGVPTAEIGGQSFEFPFSGAQGIDCVVSEEGVEVLISRSSPEYLQLQIDVRDNSGDLLGGVFVISGDEQFDSIIPADGTGLVIDGNSLTYEGSFSGPSGEELEGSASVTCG
jgi:hypothetical protein